MTGVQTCALPICEGTLRHYMRTANGLWADVAAFSLIGPEIDRTINSLRQHVEALEAAEA